MRTLYIYGHLFSGWASCSRAGRHWLPLVSIGFADGFGTAVSIAVVETLESVQER
ncbi:MAG: hypothetical protein ACLRZH_18455 [Ruthenibacterium lactatiformans]